MITRRDFLKVSGVAAAAAAAPTAPTYGEYGADEFDAVEEDDLPF